MSELIKSPFGKITFSALNRKVKRKQDDTEATVYTLRLEFDGNTPEGATFKSQIEEVNDRIIGTKNASAPGFFTVQASSKFPVMVVDKDGHEFDFEAIPSITEGHAKMMVRPYTGNSLGGSINLVAVGLGDYVEYQGADEDGKTSEERRAEAKAKLKGFLLSD